MSTISHSQTQKNKCVFFLQNFKHEQWVIRNKKKRKKHLFQNLEHEQQLIRLQDLLLRVLPDHRLCSDLSINKPKQTNKHQYTMKITLDFYHLALQEWGDDGLTSRVESFCSAWCWFVRKCFLDSLIGWYRVLVRVHKCRGAQVGVDVGWLAGDVEPERSPSTSSTGQARPASTPLGSFRQL